MRPYPSKQFIFIFGFIIIASLGYGGYRYFFTVKELKEVKNNLASTTLEFENKVKQLEADVSQARNENASLMNSLVTEQAKNNLFEEQIGTIQGAVGVLEKLNKTDEELLQKYSKVYFLNENYMPANLAEIDSKYLYNKEQPLQIHTNVQWFLYNMLENASSSGVSLRIISAYRSFGAQSSLKLSYKITYGSGANKFSADQGYSEHQLGTAVDITTPNTGESFLKFEKTTAYKWLTENAYKYGFILSYPKQNTYYQSEPWHWRFVGVALATNLHDNNKYFYNLDQREIDLYLISIFD
jgi:D-alanyl-D-alanine carboxypeptidase